MSRKGGLSNRGWLTVIAKAHLPDDVLLWLDMSVFLLWLKRERGGGSPNVPCVLSFVFFFLFSFHPHAQSDGCILFCQSAGTSDIRGFIKMPTALYMLPWRHHFHQGTRSRSRCLCCSEQQIRFLLFLTNSLVCMVNKICHQSAQSHAKHAID